MENELLQKSLDEVRRARAVLEDTGTGLKTVSARAILERTLDEAKCKLAMAIVLAGGSNWVIQSHLHRLMLVKLVRGLGGMDLAEADFILPGEPKYDCVRRLFNLSEDKADDAEVAAVLTELRIKFGDFLRTCDNMIAIRGRFFRFDEGMPAQISKYEVME